MEQLLCARTLHTVKFDVQPLPFAPVLPFTTADRFAQAHAPVDVLNVA
jgi:hypothetical protein